jgi:hypothetical protein
MMHAVLFYRIRWKLEGRQFASVFYLKGVGHLLLSYIINGMCWRLLSVHMVVSTKARLWIQNSTQKHPSIFLYRIKHIAFFLEGKPIQFSVLKNTTVHLGRTAVFRCVITGSLSKISWRHNGRNIPQMQRYRTRSYSWGGVLRIKNVRVSDYGVYTCKARNKFGQMKSNKAFLKIRGLFCYLPPTVSDYFF